MFGMSALSEVAFAELLGTPPVIAIPVSDTPGLEFTIPLNRLHYTISDEDR